MRSFFLFFAVVTFALCAPSMMKHFTYGFKQEKTKFFIPNSTRWDVPINEDVREILNQPFTFLGKGAQCYAFLSYDGNYVIKFFRFDKKINKEKVRDLFDVCKLSYDELKNETGLIYVHLNVTNLNLPFLHCKDPLGRWVQFDLDRSRFSIQKKALSFKEAIFLAKNDPVQMEKRIDQFIELLQVRIGKGVNNNDPNVDRNFGFLKDSAVEFDFGNYSFGKDFDRIGEMMSYLARFRIWLLKNAPEWVFLFDEKVEAKE